MRHELEPVVAELGLTDEEWIPYGLDKAKIRLGVLDRPRTRPKPPKLILVSAVTPTPAGEGKTTTTIGLGMGLRSLGESVCLALREPSLGPCFGMKGGATGGGKASLTPIEDIDLHFNGDFHAITSAHNLLAALVDNHLHFETDVRLDPRRVTWKRVMDMNDRSLREIVTGLGGKSNGVVREAGFDITAASEVMAMLCLASSPEDLRNRIDRTIVGFDYDGKPVTAKQVKATGPMMALLRDAMLPNLVQTVDGTPAVVHGGPFANIAHGCNSVAATKVALHLADWVITEAGFAFDLGGEKFFDIKARSAGLDTAAVVVVATVRALRMHGGAPLDGGADAGAVDRGIVNLAKHVENVRTFGERPIVALNKFGTDTDEEIEVIRAWCRAEGVPFAVNDGYARGAEGGRELGELVRRVASETKTGPYTPLYPLEAPPLEKIRAVAQKMYGARDVILSPEAARDLGQIKKLGLADLPICVAKTQNSLSDDPTKRGRPTGFDIRVRRVQIAAGAGFLVVLTGDIVRMPGLPEQPNAELIDLVDGRIVGIK
jgi:formate--tetrahydrofolate ligase